MKGVINIQIQLCSHDLISEVFNHGYKKYPLMMVIFENVLGFYPNIEPELYMILLKDYYKDICKSI